MKSIQIMVEDKDYAALLKTKNEFGAKNWRDFIIVLTKVKNKFIVKP